MKNMSKQIIISKDGVDSNIDDFQFDWEYIAKGGPKSKSYVQLISAVYYDSNDNKTPRNFQKGERKQSGLVLARLGLQIFENEIDNLTVESRRSLKTDGTGNNMGLWSSKEELFERWGNGANSGTKPSSEYAADKFMGNTYQTRNNDRYYFYNAGLYDSMVMVQDLLNRFETGTGYFKIIVKQQGDPINEAKHAIENDSKSVIFTENSLVEKVLSSSNVILRGAPGTGKTFLAQQAAAQIVSNGRVENYSELNSEERNRIDFVQFHPSYDYTDFVEGLRPVKNDTSEISFKLKSGVFKRFCDAAKSDVTIGEHTLNLEDFYDYLKNLKGNQFKNYKSQFEKLLGKTEYTGRIAGGFPTYGSLEDIILNSEEIKKIDKERKFSQYLITPVNYLLDYYKNITEERLLDNSKTKKYVFIIDEINRGEISKIFGELFFSIDPGYRGKSGAVKTQYSNLHEEGGEDFYVPENVYIIGTMNDIDRSLDSFDFAMRRRFRFIAITSEDSMKMFDNVFNKENQPLFSEMEIEEVIIRMKAINDYISSDQVPTLNENYHIGASYFLKLPELEFDYEVLWDDFLEPVLYDYLRGSYNSENILLNIKQRYENLSQYENFKNY